jgi:hypothetical protein
MYFFTADDTIETYCNRMRLDKIWGDGNMLTTAAYLYQHPIWIYSADNQLPFKIEPERIPVDARPLTLGYVAECQGLEPTHYVSLIAHMHEKPLRMTSKIF